MEDGPPTGVHQAKRTQRGESLRKKDRASSPTGLQKGLCGVPWLTRQCSAHRNLPRARGLARCEVSPLERQGFASGSGVTSPLD